MAANSAGGWRGKELTTYTRENTNRMERVRRNKKKQRENISKKQWQMVRKRVK
jgi:hypothetical protein